MTSVVVAVVPGAAVRPPEIAAAADKYGLKPAFVPLAGALSEAEFAEYADFGSVVPHDPERPDDTVELLRKHAPEGVTTFSEAMVPLTSRIGDGLGLPFHSPETMTLLTDKWAQRRRLAEAGVDAVRSVVVTDRAQALAEIAAADEPVIVKPVRSQSSRDTFLVTQPGALPADLAPSAERPFVVEEFLRGRESGDLADYVSVEAVVEAGRVRTIGISGKFPQIPPFREQGAFTPAFLPPGEAEEVTRLAAEAVLALGVRRGHTHTEIKLTADGPRIIEVNGRIGGYVAELYGRANGADLLAMGIAAACGRPVGPIPQVLADRVEFHWFNNPPLAGGVLHRVDGVDAVRTEEGVSGYLSRVAPGTRLPPETGSHWLDMLSGRAADHAAMVTTVDRCLARLRFHFEDHEGTTRIWQAGRSGLCATD
ncbi:ATP-grasp domain-containing protein [Streptomyces sp. LP05-1]|uniref:ATP-grasp domain-containing protein n=1 Tax=Streptomyces pyxinae TaxID=2970734 RepID=A0ABT2CQT0_9ACTN|nr:ATP-grasp domain-containing protein [Streptomyces sp. LP05-1]MCS0639790.1 ATP-grasp domain-containing protein [Streptomyces sp. LP05-1]